MYEYLPHESDLFIRGKGRTFNYALFSVLEGLIAHINEDKEISSAIYTASAEGLDDKDLAFNLLDNFNAFIDSEGILPCKAKRLTIDDKKIEFSFSGKKTSFASPVKAVTYHNFKVQQENEEWIIEVLFDI
ncbi:MAG: archease [Candidatus Micrarchaeota archaeon]|nr:archease [Candidatus Micrarchaeota archaeon]